MKNIFLLLGIFACFDLSAKKSSGPAPGTKAKFYYYEVPPQEEKTILIRAIKCDPKNNELFVDEFSSTKAVVDGSVVAINLYARAGQCKHSPLSSVWYKEIKVPKREKWAHVYLTTLSDNILVLE